MDPISNENMNDETLAQQAKLTAYVLGELNEQETKEVEAMIAADPALQAEVDDIRRVASQLQAELGSEAGEHLSLSDAQKEAIHAKATTAGPQPRSVFQAYRWVYWAGGSALAACLAIALLLPALNEPQRQARRLSVSQQQELLAYENGQRTSQGQADISSPGRTPSSSLPAAKENKDLDRLRSNADARVDQLAGAAGHANSPSTSTSSGRISADDQFRKLREEPVISQPQGQVARDQSQSFASSLEAVPSELNAKPNQPNATSAPVSGQLSVDGESVGSDIALSRRAFPTSPPVGDSRIMPMPPQVIGGFVPHPAHHTEAYDAITDNPFLKSIENPLSTFSIDVDTASYTNIRRFLNSNQLPPPGAVRIEEMINYFPYTYSGPADDKTPFAVHVETSSAPWASSHRLVKIGLKGKTIAAEEKQPMNLVFLIDVSGSMNSQDKLPLLREGMKLLVKNLDENDRVAIVVYAGAAGMVLDSTSGHDKATITAAIDRLQSGGSTNGGAGIRLAYDLATKNFNKNGVNRVILASDGDFNVGTTSRDELVSLIEDKRKTGVFLSVLGFGRGNLKDSTMEQLANKGNGNYSYIDSIREANKVLVEDMAGTLVTIAKDVKIQVEFNPAKVQAYRLIGYENRLLTKEDFNDDTKDAGEIGAGHTVTALYEVVPVGAKMPGIPPVDELKYQTPAPGSDVAKPLPATPAGEVSNELLTVKLRYKQPDGDVSTKLDVPVVDNEQPWQQASPDFRFAAGVAQFGMLLRNSPHKGDSDYAQVLDLAQSGLGQNPDQYRQEFITLVQKARELQARTQPNRGE